ncbi:MULTISPECIES: hypothetical protein [unclassified Streptomyces]|uniref:hypothetical protein n=1 Tax=unclassified Streptomyces TaxID=2593676 RepID=UPI002E2E8129|nr:MULTISPECIES: hypothetical protein [unclassified Streptomyces]
MTGTRRDIVSLVRSYGLANLFGGDQVHRPAADGAHPYRGHAHLEHVVVMAGPHPCVEGAVVLEGLAAPGCRGGGQQLPCPGQLGVNVLDQHPKQGLELSDPVVHQLRRRRARFP